MKIKKTIVLPQTCWELPVVRPTVGGGCRGGDGGKNWHKSERKRWKWKFMCKHTHFESVKWMNASKQANREMRIRFSRNLQLGCYARQEKKYTRWNNVTFVSIAVSCVFHHTNVVCDLSCCCWCCGCCWCKNDVATAVNATHSIHLTLVRALCSRWLALCFYVCLFVCSWMCRQFVLFVLMSVL